MKTLFIINEAPSGNEKIYHALRTAKQLQKDRNAEIRIYLFADGVRCALLNDAMPAGPSNVAQMVTDIIQNKGKVKMCTSCGETRGVKEMKLIQGVEWASLKDLTDWITESDKILNY